MNENIFSSKETNLCKNIPFRVFVRIRPLLEKEKVLISEKFKENSNNAELSDYLNTDESKIRLSHISSSESYLKKEKIFSFDYVFKSNIDNETIFSNVIRQQVDNILQGINATAMMYGITGTGKTHTMFGDIYEEINFEKGVCMYAIDYLFDKIVQARESVEFKVKISYLEIYNEQVKDLLSNKEENDHLMVVEEPNRGVFVPNLSEYEVLDSESVLKFIMRGNQRRTMAATGSNVFSSRSHAILQIALNQKNIANKIKDESVTSKFLLVDLAGSERGGLEKGIRAQEGSNINKSLLALGTCINLLSDKSKKGSFIPYRDSKLTRILKDSLGGNISTIMISCISPSPLLYDETVNTLSYASRARNIEKKVFKLI